MPQAIGTCMARAASLGVLRFVAVVMPNGL